MGMALTKMDEKKSCKVLSISGSKRFLDRVCAMGLTPNTSLQVIQNKKRQPMLIYARDTMIALNREESERIIVEGVK